MKNLILIILLSITSIVCGQNVKLFTSVGFDSLSLTSDSYEVPRGTSIGAVLCDSLKTSSLTIEVSGDNTNWFKLQNEGSDYSIAVDSTLNTANSLKPIVLYPYIYIRFIRTNSTTPWTMPIMVRQY